MKQFPENGNMKWRRKIRNGVRVRKEEKDKVRTSYKTRTSAVIPNKKLEEIISLTEGVNPKSEQRKNDRCFQFQLPLLIWGFSHRLSLPLLLQLGPDILKG